jgi:hypothetical protein
VASYVAQTERMLQLAKDRGIEPTAEGIATAAGLSARVMRGVLAGHPVSNRTWQALTRLFGAEQNGLLFAEAGSPKDEEAARAAQLVRLRAKFDALTPAETDPIVAAAAQQDASIRMRIARDEARANGAGARHAAAFLAEQHQPRPARRGPG